MIETRFKDTEIGKIPEEWEVKTIGEIFTFKNGINKGKSFFGTGTPIINYMDVYHHSSLTNNDIRGKVSLNKNEIRNSQVYKGDVFFTRTSETPEEVGLTSVLLEDVPDCTFSGFLLRGRPFIDDLDLFYCKYCFRTKQVRNDIIRNCTYTTRALTNGRILSNIYIALPPLSEQRRIADALSKVDSLIESLDKLIAKKKAIKRGAMQELLTGKKRLPGFEGEWTYKRLGDISDIYQPETISQERFIERGYPVYGANGIIGFYSKYNHHTDQILITCRGNSCGTVNYSRGKCWITGNAMVVNLDNRIDCYKLFYYYYLTYLDLTTLVSGSGQPQITRKPVEYQKVVIPSLSEQRAIAHVLSTMDAEIDALKQKRDKIKQVKQGMMQDLLTGRIRLVDK